VFLSNVKRGRKRREGREEGRREKDETTETISHGEHGGQRSN
jgi:hypothetical protein